MMLYNYVKIRLRPEIIYKWIGKNLIKILKVSDHSEMDIDRSALLEKSNIMQEWVLVTAAVDRLIFIIFTMAFSIIMIEIWQFPT